MQDMKSILGIIFVLLATLQSTDSTTIRESNSFPKKVSIVFRCTVQGKPLQFDHTYENSFGEDYTVLAFRFYISHLAWTGSKGKEYIRMPEKYRLFDAGDSTTNFIEAYWPGDTATGLDFQLGVDSIDNVSGAQAGALDPAKGMFWTWNTGYVMAKLEGQSSFSRVPTGAYSYHIGGFSGANNTIKKIGLSFTVEQQAILVKSSSAELIIEAEVSRWFDSIHRLKIAEQSFIHGPGTWAKLYSDNYATMFKVAAVRAR